MPYPLTSPLIVRLCGGLALVWISTARAGAPIAVTHSIDENLTRYTVTAEGLEELYARMELSKPEKLAGKDWDAYTSWWITWTIHSAPDAKSCDSVALNLTIDTTLPYWDVGRGVPYSDERESWDRYLEALTKHEEEHAELARRTVGLLERRIASLPDDVCQDIAASVEDLGQNTVARSADDERDMDRRSDHGREHGAVRP